MKRKSKKTKKADKAWGLYAFNGQSLVSVCTWRGNYDESARQALEIEWNLQGFPHELGYRVKKITVIDEEPER